MTNAASAHGISMRLVQGEPSHQSEDQTTPGLGEAGLVSRLAEDLARELGCPVEVMYLHDIREVVAIAYPVPGCEVQVSLPVSPISLPLIDDPFGVMKHALLRELRQQIGPKPET